MPIQAEYIWIDGAEPTKKLRSKTKIVDFGVKVPMVGSNFPEWGFDGSSTCQADGGDSDCVLKPVSFVLDPIRPQGRVESLPNYLVMCEVYNGDGVTPHPTNTRAELRRVLDAGAKDQEPWFGIEQEYTLLNTDSGHQLGFDAYGRPPGDGTQGPYYCSVGAGVNFGNQIVEEHRQACLDAGLLIFGTNSEVAPGQHEFQIGTDEPLKVSDHLWLARWLLSRIAEKHGVTISLEPKIHPEFNGSGAHTNFSTAAMRQPSTIARIGVNPYAVWGTDAIKAACLLLSQKTEEHIAVYGHGIEKRLTGQHETCSYKEFRWGVADRGASIRIPRGVKEQGFGYLEDRRPCANIDPYVVTARILKTVCKID